MKLETQSPFTNSLLALASSVPLGARGRVWTQGRNDMATSQILMFHWIVRDPGGLVVLDECDKTLFGVAPGDTEDRRTPYFDLDKLGTYSLKADLLMNPDSPVVVDSYDGDLCSTVELPPTCKTDADCPEGYVCVNGVCVPKEEVEKKFPWGPVAIGAGALVAIVGLAAAAKRGR